jgi:hypothetical protein
VLNSTYLTNINIRKNTITSILGTTTRGGDIMFLGDRYIIAPTTYSIDLSVLFDNNTVIESPTNALNLNTIKAVTGTATAMGAILV